MMLRERLQPPGPNVQGELSCNRKARCNYRKRLSQKEGRNEKITSHRSVSRTWLPPMNCACIRYVPHKVMQSLLYMRYVLHKVMQSLLYMRYVPHKIMQRLLYMRYVPHKVMQSLLYVRYVPHKVMQSLLYKTEQSGIDRISARSDLQARALHHVAMSNLQAGVCLLKQLLSRLRTCRRTTSKILWMTILLVAFLQIQVWGVVSLARTLAHLPIEGGRCARSVTLIHKANFPVLVIMML
jgi:hypothetical protein